MAAQASLSEAAAIFEETIRWLRSNYDQFRFFNERDVVWTAQQALDRAIRERGAALRVVHDYPILPGTRRSLTADIALIAPEGKVEVAAEFKFEPSHTRDDIWPSKINPSVVFWGADGVGGDVERIHRFIMQGVAKVAYSVFIDEEGYFRKRAPHAQSQWIDWSVGPDGKAAVLWSCAKAPVAL